MRINRYGLAVACLLFLILGSSIAKSKPQDQQFEIKLSAAKTREHYIDDDHGHKSLTKQMYYLNFVKNDRLVKSFRVDKLGRVDPYSYVDSVKVLTYKKVNNVYYILFWYECPSNPWNPEHQCGAGTEEYVASLQLSSNLRILKIDNELVYSCFNSIDKKYTYNKRHPEYGFHLADTVRY